MWVLIGKLESERWKDCLKITPVLKVPRTEEAGTKPSIRKTHLSERLGDGRLSCPSEAIQPEHTLVSLVH